MQRRILLLAALVIGISGCDFIKTLTGEQATKNKAVDAAAPANTTTTTMDPHAAATATPAAAPATPKCPDGSQPQVIAGDCSGEWSVGRQGKNLVCEFKWGPTIKCPAGTKAMGLESVCYGTTARPLTEKQTANSAAKCEELFGKYPQSPKYEITCCKG